LRFLNAAELLDLIRVVVVEVKTMFSITTANASRGSRNAAALGF
jgi:hypothetical protein